MAKRHQVFVMGARKEIIPNELAEEFGIDEGNNRMKASQNPIHNKHSIH